MYFPKTLRRCSGRAGSGFEALAADASRLAAALLVAIAAMLEPRTARADDAEAPIAERLEVEPSCLCGASDRERRGATSRARNHSIGHARLSFAVIRSRRPAVAVEVRVDGAVAAERRFEPFAGGCALAEEAVTLALAMDLDALDRPKPHPVEPTPSPTPPANAPKPPVAPAKPRHWHLDADAEGFISFGSFDAAEFGASPGLAITDAGERLRLRAAGWFTAEDAAIVGHGFVAAHVLVARLDGCGAPFAVDVLHVWLCAGVGAGQLARDEGEVAHPLQIPVFARAEVDLPGRAALQLSCRRRRRDLDDARALSGRTARRGPPARPNASPVLGATFAFGASVTIY